MVAVSLGGCVDGEIAPANGPASVEWYRVSYEGSNRFVSDKSHGWLDVFTNHGTEEVIVSVARATAVMETTTGPQEVPVAQPVVYSMENGVAEEMSHHPNLARSPYGATAEFSLAPGESRLVGTDLFGFTRHIDNITQRAFYFDGEAKALLGEQARSWTVEEIESADAVQPGMHVQTVTVGFWLNGTSFYTNAADLINDPDFPGAPAWVTAEDGTDPLTVYVYDEDRSEQPYGSQDNCYFTTISGYNALLKTQHEGSTGIRLLQPEEAYTIPGREPGDALYGDALVFMNTIVAIDGSPGTEDEAPDPNGACYREDRVCQEAPEGVPDDVRAGCRENLSEEEP